MSKRTALSSDKKTYRFFLNFNSKLEETTTIHAYVTTPISVNHYILQNGFSQQGGILLNNPTKVVCNEIAYVIHQNYISFYSIKQGTLQLFGAIYLNAPTSIAFNNNIAYVTTANAVSYYSGQTLSLLGTKAFSKPIFIAFNNNIGYVINAINPSMSYISYHRPDTLKEFGKKLYIINPTSITFNNNIAYVTTPLAVTYYSIAEKGFLTLLGSINISSPTSVAFHDNTIYITTPTGIFYYKLKLELELDTFELLGKLDIIGTSLAFI